VLPCWFLSCHYLVRMGEIMPLVRIDMLKKTDPTFAQRVGKIVYESMRTAINVPEHDNFQILTEHDELHFIHDPNYLGIEYTLDLVIIQITLNEGRTQDQKKLLFKSIAEGLHEQLGLRMADVFVNLVEVRKENWSFGNGMAQYAS
jgi:phenylpyruvate tautomerase PptA (4-oxalocrotonate tautomerase family)